jgi:hypothetical protein
MKSGTKIHIQQPIAHILNFFLLVFPLKKVFKCGCEPGGVGPQTEMFLQPLRKIRRKLRRFHCF